MAELVATVHFQAITTLLKEIGERVEGNLFCDVTPDGWTYERNKAKIHNLQVLCKDKRRIVEIGVNACHSLLLMLLINPTAEYLLFDLNNHRYTEPILAYIKKAFPTTKITAIFGTSVKTVPEYLRANPSEHGTYDLCHLDGGHTYDIFSVDYASTRQLLKPGGHVVFDDYEYPEIYAFLTSARHSGEIVLSTASGLVPTNLHCIYTYAK